MSAVIHHGPPGSYKTFTIIQQVCIPALYEGRTVITNIRGFNDLDKVEAAMGKPLPEGVKLVNVEHTHDGFETMARFFQWADMGALIVIDEAQKVYPVGSKSLDKYTYDPIEPEAPKSVAEAFDKHRHMNWDIYLSTTNIAKVHKEVRLVIEWAYRHRDISGLVPWYKNRWRQFRHDPENNGKSLSNVDNTTTHKADFKVFNCYQSTATGEAKTSAVKRSIFQDKKLLAMGFVILCAIAVFINAVGNAVAVFSDDPEEIDNIGANTAEENSNISNNDASRITTNKIINSSANPLADAEIYYIGRFNSRLYEVQHKDGARSVFSDIELLKFGYQITHYSMCFFELQKDQIKTYHHCLPDQKQEQQEVQHVVSNIQLL